MTSSLLPYFNKCAYFSKISYWAFLRRVTSYRRKAPYISCCVVFKDGINFIKLYDVLCIINRNISVKLYRINIERWRTNIYDYTNIKLFVPFNIWHFSRYLLKNTFLEKRCFRIHVRTSHRIYQIFSSTKFCQHWCFVLRPTHCFTSGLTE